MTGADGAFFCCDSAMILWNGLEGENLYSVSESEGGGGERVGRQQAHANKRFL